MIRLLFSASLLLATSSGLYAQYTKLLDFDGSPRGSTPLYNSLISDGTFLYGMTSDGGTANNGVIFKIKSDGTGFLKLRDFGTSPDGDRPFGSLYYDGTFLFGMTIRGGANTEGTIFKIKTDGTGYLKIFDFSAAAGNLTGTDPYGSLVSDGTFLYGMTSVGGANSKGTVFKILKDGTGFVKLRDFSGGTSDGQGPFGDLLLSGSFLYGMAESGGTTGGGVIFKMQTDGTNFSLLHSFGSGTDADSPYTGFLVSDGTFLYGTALIGGTNDYGAIFKIKPDGTGYTLIHSFATNNGTPYGSLTYDGSFLYGLTSEGGPANAGTLYKIKPDGTGFAVLMNFDGTTNGSGYAGYGTPYYESSALYGMSLTGGTSNLGTIFKYSLPAASCLPATERNALIALYNATSGAGWNDNSNWLSADESTWFGVTISGCHVTALNLSENNLVGPLPAAMGDLVNLTELDLSFNEVTGNLPATFASLSALEVLHLDHNQITGPIPSFLGSLSSLTSIDLSVNLFDGFIPTTLGNLSNLNYLSLAVNELDGEIPTELGGLSNLEVLDLSSNLLYGQIPVELGDLSSLLSLKLGSNLLEGGIPPELGNIASLLELNLEQNRLDGVIPGDLGNLTNLRVLFLGNNLLVGSVPFELGPMPALEEVSLVHNSFTSIPDFTSSNIIQLAVEENLLNFGDLEPNAAVTGYTYDPQALLPPGGVIQFIVGGTVFIPFGTAGTANSYQWVKDGVPIPGATSAAFMKSGAVVGDVGLYFVRVTNSIVPNVTLVSEVFTVITDPCTGTPRGSGQLDATFNAHLDNPADPKALGLQSTGKIIASLPSTFIISVEVEGIVRFNTDGSLDNTFNSSSDRPDEGQLLVQSDDKIVYFYASEIHRLNADGTDDAAFNTNAPNYYNSTIYALAQQPDGKILIAVNEDGNYFVDRINTDGTNDPTFNDPTDLDVSVIRVQSDGKILLGGYFFGGILRLNSDGSSDSPFNENSTDEGVLDIAIQPDGKIIVIGLFSYFNGLPHHGIVRLNSNGIIDNSFAAIGITDQIESGNHPIRVAIQTDGKILLAGLFDTVNGATRKNLVRLNSDGTVDCPFSPGLSTNEIINNMILQQDNRILIGGDFTTYDGTTRNGLARVNTGPSITITQQPADAIVCVGANATFTTNATGTTNITFRWQFSATGAAGSFADISDGPNYSGTGTNVLTVNTTASFGVGRYRSRINGDGAQEVITNDEGLFVNAAPAAPTTTGNTGCSPSALLLTAAGGSPGQYRWYTVSSGGTAIAGIVNSTYTTPSLTVTTTYYVARSVSSCESARTAVIATIDPGPTPPVTTGASSCGSGTLLLLASGGTNGQYRWYTVSTGGSPIAGEVNGNYTTPVIPTTTNYFVALNNGTCEGGRSTVVAAINTIPAAPVTTDGTSCGPSNTVALNASGGSAGQYRWYSVAAGGTAIAGAVNSAFTTPVLTTTTTFYVSVNNGPCESSRTAVVANIVFCNQPPVIAAASATVPVSGSTTISLLSLISDPDNNLDLSTLNIVSNPTSGASASIVNGVLSVNYAGIAFAGSDQLTIRVCDVVGACVQRVVTIDVTGDLIVYNGVSPNNDGDNDKWIIKYIDLIPDARENKVSIFNRWGDEVFATENYDNLNRVFVGIGKGGSELSSGTYFYKIEFTSGRAPLSGYITLKR